MSENLEQRIAELIAEHVTIGYELRPDGLVDPNTIRVASAVGAAHMVVHALRHNAFPSVAATPVGK